MIGKAVAYTRGQTLGQIAKENQGVL